MWKGYQEFYKMKKLREALKCREIIIEYENFQIQN